MIEYSGVIREREVIDNIDSERKFVELLGLKVMGPDNSNRYYIFNNDDKRVGFIQRKKYHNKKMKKGVVVASAIYGYHMEIETDTISYKGTRKLNNRGYEVFEDKSYRYEFQLKKDGESFADIVLEMGDSVSIVYRDEKGKFMDFRLGHNNLYLNFFSETKKFEIEETICVKNDRVKGELEKDYNSEYSYCVSFCDRNSGLDDIKSRTTFEFDCVHRFYQWLSIGKEYKPYMNINTLEWRNKKLVEKVESREVVGTISDAIVKHEYGIKAFNHYRYLINQLLPFEGDIFDSLVERCEEDANEFVLFIPELDKKKDVLKKERVFKS